MSEDQGLPPQDPKQNQQESASTSDLEMNPYQPPAGPAGDAAPAALPTIGDSLSKAWEILKANPLVILASFLVGILISSASAFPAVGPLLALVVTGPLSVGLARYFLDLVDGKPGDFGVLFQYFQKGFGPACLAGILINIFSILGFLALCVGFFVVIAVFGFTYLVLADNRADDAWPAMMVSKGLVSQDWFRLIGFYWVIGLVGVLGVLACIVGLFVTGPLAALAIVVGYRTMVPKDSSPLTQEPAPSPS